MAFNELIDTFHGLQVVDFNGAADWQGPDKAYRLREEYEDEVSMSERLTSLIERGGTQVRALIIGTWTGSCEGSDCEATVKELSQSASQLPALRALFLGEMTFEECEISWIKQSDVAPVLKAFSKLETLRVRGGDGLAFSQLEHMCLKELAIETGGLSRSTLRELFQCQFPALEHIELLLGEENYGFDGGVEDLQPILSGKLYPKLKYLGLMNSMIANDIAAVLVNSPILRRIETLDLSMGNLDGEGFQSLHGLSQYPQLKKVILSHHYASAEAVAALKAALKCEVDASDDQTPDDEWRPIVHAE